MSTEVTRIEDGDVAGKVHRQFLRDGTERTLAKTAIETVKQLDFATAYMLGILAALPSLRADPCLGGSNVDLLCRMAVQGAKVQVIQRRHFLGHSPPGPVVN
ncbi:hypothetical protein PG994_015181 [Apiospora phragmitis]|uniref:Uncharacterized protein n=1 Tax=Apiospora phragmitis TaxID=2905665 RepID=A0ABR1SVR5_9PEZI